MKVKRNSPPLYMPASQPSFINSHLGARGKQGELTVVGGNGELKVEEILGVGEVGLHRRRKVELGEIWKVVEVEASSGRGWWAAEGV